MHGADAYGAVKTKTGALRKTGHRATDVGLREYGAASGDARGSHSRLQICAACLCAGLLFKALAQARTLPCCRGAAPSMQDSGPPADRFAVCRRRLAVASHLCDGQIKAPAVLASARWAPTPDVPTIDEAGVPGLHLSLWNGIWAPKGTPHEVVMKLNSVIRSALADAAVKQRLLELGQITPSSEQQTPQALAAYHQAEIEKWWPIIKAANIKVK